MAVFDIKVIEVGDKEVALAQLRQFQASPVNFQEIWVRANNLKCCILSNQNRAWLMVLRYEGDAGFSSRNPMENSKPDELVKFQLGNGQIDEYPKNWTFQKEHAFAAVSEFIETGKFPKFVKWENDSDDGRSQPDE